MSIQPKKTDHGLIIAVNPMPRLYIVDLVKSLPHEKIAILTFYRDKPLLPEETVYELESLGAKVDQYAYKNKVEYINHMRQAISQLRKCLAASTIEVFHCQPNHLLTNYPTFGVDRSKYQNYSVSLLPDGAANFYHPATKPYERNMRFKAILGRLLGIPFHPYRGSYLGTEHGVYERYFSLGNPGVMEEMLPITNIEVKSSMPLEMHEDTLLVLGQPQSPPGAAETYRRYLEAVKKLPFEVIHYKAHPGEDPLQAQRFCNEYGFVKVEFTQSTEEAAVGYSNVVGIASSVLLNLRLLGWHDDLVSVLNPQFLAQMTGREASIMEELAQAFVTAGIKELTV